MPFKSEKQRRYMHANLPKIAKRWEKDYASGGIARLGFYNGNTVAPFPGIQQNNMLTNMQKMRPTTLGIMTGQYMPGISPHYGGYNPIDPYGNIQMGLEKDDIRSGAQVQKQPAWYNRMFNKVGQGITGLTNKMGDMFSNKKNLAGNLIGMAMGIPGLGAMLGSIRPDTPYEKFQKQMFKDMGFQGDSNKDPFGKNVRSIFGNYDVVEQFDKLAGSKLGEKYGYAEAMKDGVLSDEELEAMQDIDPVTGKPRGLKGWQLERFKTLFEAKKRADKYQKDVADRAREERMAKERERQSQMAQSDKVVFDSPKGPRGDGGGSWHEQTAAKEKAGVQVAGPGFGKGAYFSQGGLASLWPR